jgi:hypothetical protein
MGTSNLYKGPKGTSLLPADYTGEPDEQQPVVAPDGESSADEQSENDEPAETENPEQEDPLQKEQPRVTWTQAKRTFSTQIGKRKPDVKWITKTYTKASGGYKHAAKTSGSSKRVARGIITFFSGTPDVIRQRLEQIGIVFEGRSTQEIFNDIYSHLCTGASSREDALADKALSQTFSELFESELMNEQGLDVFKPELLEFLVSHFVTNSIYYKLLNEVAFGELTGNKSNADIAKIEDDLKTFIDGLVSGRVPEYLHEGITPDEVNKMVDNLYEDCYKVMEGLVE